MSYDYFKQAPALYWQTFGCFLFLITLKSTEIKSCIYYIYRERFIIYMYVYMYILCTCMFIYTCMYCTRTYVCTHIPICWSNYSLKINAWRTTVGLDSMLILKINTYFRTISSERKTVTFRFPPAESPYFQIFFSHVIFFLRFYF